MKSFFPVLLFALVLLAPHPSLAAGASFALLGPSSVSAGQEFQVTVQLRGASDTDVVRLLGSYSQNLLTWRSIQPSSVFPNVSPGNGVDQQNGTFSFGNFTLDNYPNGTVKTATISLKARQEGTAVLTLLSGSEAYSAGEPSSPSLSTLRIRIGAATLLPVLGLPETIKGPNVTEAAKETVTLFSLTHPDTDLWYSNPNIEVGWRTEKPVASVSASFDQSPDATSYHAIPGATAKFTATSDGLWYVHLIIVYQDKTFGRADMLFRYDGTPPRPIAPVVEQTDVSAKIQNRLVFGTVDETSGIDHYDVILDGQRVTSTVLMAYPLKNQTAGPHEAEVIAFDRAGNFTSGKTSYRILASGGVSSASPSFLSFFENLTRIQQAGLLALVVLAGICSWFFFFFRRKSKRKKHK